MKLLVALAALLLAACTGGAGRPATSPRSPRSAGATAATGTAAVRPATTAARAITRRWRHVVVVVEENRDAGRILGRRDAPFLNRLARGGLVLTDMHGETHPSQPNYLALFSGSTQRLRDDSCPHTYRGDNLARQLLSARLSFASYAEGLPSRGSQVCRAGGYVRRHAPWTNFPAVPRSQERAMSAFPRDLDRLPTLSFVVPALADDMHDGSVARGDRWLHTRLGRYAAWARTHHSLLLVTWDEDENTRANHIATLAYGQGVTPGRWTRRADHYSLLATIEQSFGLPRLGRAAHRTLVTPLL